MQVNIFPADTLATSITTTVLIGVWVVVFFNLRLGWLLSGLVVPGYLVPLIIAKPISAVVILLEAVLTFVVVWCISETCRRRAYWSSLFGRDRFFALVLVSILIRVLMDGWLLPAIGPRLDQLLGGNFDYRNHLHSYGLIIVALMANYFWKPGLRQGLCSLGVTVGGTYLIVRFLVVEFTNFNVGSLQYMYEDVASSLLASPKSYIILITTAFLASWMNLRYSWDYNGILVPSLLALQWYSPYKILASFVEALAILLLAKLVLCWPIWQRSTVEGGRKILLFFNLAFLYRLGLAYLLPVWLPELKVSDAFGFGYLLSTLLAIRAYEQRVAIRLTRASLQVSLMGALVGSLVGFGLTFLPRSSLPSTVSTRPTSETESAAVQGDIATLLRRDMLGLYRQRLSASCVVPLASEVDCFQQGLGQLAEYRRTQDSALLETAQAALRRANYAVHEVDDRYLYLRERQPSRGWGLFVFDLQNTAGLLVEVPAPLDEWSTVEAGLCLFHQLKGGALAIAGAGRPGAKGAASVLSDPLSIYGLFHRQIARGNVLEVRGQTRDHLRSFVRAGLTASLTDVPPSSLWIKGAIPAGCELAAVRGLLDSWQVRWRTTPLENVLRDNTRRGFAELVLTRADRRKLLARLLAVNGGRHPGAQLEISDAPFRQWLLDCKQRIARRGTDLYQAATAEELLYLDEQVVKPLLRLVQQNEQVAALTSTQQAELQAISSAAGILNYRLIVLTGQQYGADLVALCETDSPSRRHWGTYVFPCGGRGRHLIEVPRPIHERNVVDFAASLFARLPATAMLIAGAHPGANLDGSADLIRWENKVNMFNLVHQAVLRESAAVPMMIASIRGTRSAVDADVILALADGARNSEQFTPLQQELVASLQADGWQLRLADGSRQTAGYEVGNSPQYAVLVQAANKQFANLWLGPQLRMSYRPDSQAAWQQTHCETLGIPTLTADLYEYLSASANQREQCAIPHGLRTLVDGYVRSRDLIRLRKAQVEYPAYRLIRLIDRTSRRAFLLIDQPGCQLLPAVVSLAECTRNESVRVHTGPLRPQQVERFVGSRASWLLVETEP